MRISIVYLQDIVFFHTFLEPVYQFPRLCSFRRSFKGSVRRQKKDAGRLKDVDPLFKLWILLVGERVLSAFEVRCSKNMYTRPANGSLSTHACSAAHHQGVTGRCILHAYHMPVRHLVRCRITLYFTVLVPVQHRNVQLQSDYKIVLYAEFKWWSDY